jgi:hypothetical protein
MGTFFRDAMTSRLILGLPPKLAEWSCLECCQVTRSAVYDQIVSFMSRVSHLSCKPEIPNVELQYPKDHALTNVLSKLEMMNLM